MRFAHSPLVSVMVSLAVWLAARTLQPLLDGADYMVGVSLVVGLSAGLGALGALLRAPRILTIVVQFLALGGVLAWWAGNVAAGLGEGDEGPLGSVLLVVGAGADAVRSGTLPLGSQESLLWLVAAVVALVTIAMELLVNGLEQPAWGLAPIVVLYGIGALALPYEMSWRHFALIAAGYVGILLVTTSFGSGRRTGSRTQVARFQTSRVVVAATLTVVAGAIALIVTPAVPLAQKQPWLDAGSDAPIQLADPTIRLNENLNRPDETEVLFYETSTGEPTYLRTVALTRMSTSGAQLVPMQLATSGLSGAYDAPGEPLEVDVEMVYSSEYLPVPFAVDGFRADGRWAHDPDTLAVVATGRERTEQTNGLRYSATAVVPSPERTDLESATAGTDPAGDETLAVPEGLDAGVRELTSSLTAEAGSDGAKALAIQSFLRSESFEYSLEAPQSTSLDAISSFLLEERAGYCIHYAAAMVAMARIEGIPARMAVGFTPGTPTDDGGFVVTTHNMHTWPELYFEDLGWVPFEPTKSIASPPDYTAPDAAPSAPPTPTATPSPTPTAGATPPPSPSPSPTPTPVEPDAVDDSEGLPGGWGILAAVLFVVACPLLVRTGQRLWRLRSGQEPTAAAAAAWREVESLFADLRLEWDDRSPSLAAPAMASRVSPDSAALLDEVAQTVERARFARGGADVSTLSSQVGALRRDLLRTLSGSRQVRALFLPVSLLGGHR